MKLRVLTIACIAAFSQFAVAEPMNDAQLSKIVGGATSDTGNGDVLGSVETTSRTTSSEAGGGVIAVEKVDFQTTNKGTVQLSDQTQQDARGVNIVNSSESTVGNGVNVWASTSSAQTKDASSVSHTDVQTQVLQGNAIAQNQARSASLGTYNTFVANVDTSLATTSSLKRDASVTATGSNSGGNQSDSLKSNAGGSAGIAASGNANIQLDAGKISVHPELDVHTKASAAWGLLSGEVDLNLKAPVDIDLPKLGVSIDGSACGVSGGSCSAGQDGHDTGNYDTKLASAPRTQLKDAKAEYILLGGGNVVVNADNQVVLSSQAQQNIRGVNIVNAASSVVGNGVNVAYSAGCCTTYLSGIHTNISQINILNQSR